MEQDMKSSTTSGAGSLTPGLPRGLSLIIHVIMLVALGLTLHSHREHDSAMHGRADAVLTGLVAAQVLLYLLFFTLPAQIRWPAWPWFRDGGEPRFTWMWWANIVTSVALVLAESRIDRSFQWFLFPYLCHVLVRPFRVSIPTMLGIVAAFGLNLIGWNQPQMGCAGLV